MTNPQNEFWSNAHYSKRNLRSETQRKSNPCCETVAVKQLARCSDTTRWHKQRITWAVPCKVPQGQNRCEISQRRSENLTKLRTCSDTQMRMSKKYKCKDTVRKSKSRYHTWGAFAANHSGAGWSIASGVGWTFPICPQPRIQISSKSQSPSQGLLFALAFESEGRFDALPEFLEGSKDCRQREWIEMLSKLLKQPTSPGFQLSALSLWRDPPVAKIAALLWANSARSVKMTRYVIRWQFWRLPSVLQ